MGHPEPMPVSTDALTLADFVELHPGQRILDLGSGQGPVALSLCARESVEVVGVEILMEAVDEARRQMTAEAPLLKGQCRFEPGDLRNEEFIRELGAFDQAVCNPPYHKMGDGRLPPDPARAAARHETTCTLEDVIRAARWALGDTGALSLILLPIRLPECLALLAGHGFSAAELQPVYTKRKRRAERALLRAVRGAETPLSILPPRQLRAINAGL